MTKMSEDNPAFDHHPMDTLNCIQIPVETECQLNNCRYVKAEVSIIAITNAEAMDCSSVTKTDEAEPQQHHENFLASLQPYLHRPIKTIQMPNMKKKIKLTAITVLLLCYMAFFIAVLMIPSKGENGDYWCDSDGLLLIITIFATIGIFYFKVFKVYLMTYVINALKPYFKKIKKVKSKRFVREVLYVAVIAFFLVLLIIDSVDDRQRLVSAFGVFALIGIGTLMSAFPKQINYYQVLCGIFIQILFGFFILRWPVGRRAFSCTGDKVSTFLNFTYVGSTFAFGKIVTEMNSYVFSFLTMILFFGMFVSIFYYYGIIQWVILKVGWLLEVTMGTTPCESMSAAANIFLGLSEAPLVIKPYLSLMTKSEIHAVITGGYATIAGTILAAYISFGISPSHLISASVMSAPAALAMSKLFYPETEKSVTTSSNIKVLKSEEKNVLHAIMNGIWSAIPLIAIITASIIAFLAAVAFLNSLLDWGCQLLNFDEGTCEIQGGLAYLLMPIAWIMGTPNDECYKVGYLLGTKIILTEFIAYRDLMTMFKKGLISARSVSICTYAFCGFSSIGSMGCSIGALGSMAPTRVHDISEVIFRALIAGNFASYLTACIAGTLIQDSSSRAIPYNGTIT